MLLLVNHFIYSNTFIHQCIFFSSFWMDGWMMTFDVVYTLPILDVLVKGKIYLVEAKIRLLTTKKNTRAFKRIFFWEARKKSQLMFFPFFSHNTNNGMYNATNPIENDDKKLYQYCRNIYCFKKKKKTMQEV